MCMCQKGKGRSSMHESTLYRLLGYSYHENAYRIKDILSSRNAQIMEDMFDSGKCMQQSGINPIEYQITDEAYNDHDNGVDNVYMDAHTPDSVSIHERPLWKQLQRSSRHPWYTQHQTFKFLSGSKRHVHTQSLEAFKRRPVEKRYRRGAIARDVHTSSVQGTASPLEVMSALLAFIDEEAAGEEEECAHVEDSVGEMLMTLSSACESEF
uniref:Uncharacterized protein n=1 Tax=Peronospora matthiolae TaxID=2874970 RepID=A0AAV1TWA8_9STRA